MNRRNRAGLALALTALQVFPLQGCFSDTGKESSVESTPSDLEKGITSTFVDRNGDKVLCYRVEMQPGLAGKVPEGGIPLKPSTLADLPGSAPAMKVMAKESCAEGSVPVLDPSRYSAAARKQGLPLAKSAALFYPRTIDRAIARKTANNLGVSSSLSVHSPSVEKDHEWSENRVKVRTIGSNYVTSIEFGIHVYPEGYNGSSIGRMYLAYEKAGSTSTQWRDFAECLNKGHGFNEPDNGWCNDFVQTDNSVYLGGGFDGYSVIGGGYSQATFQIIKDGTGGNWWLKFGDKWVGYLPKAIFNRTSMDEYASEFEVGGETAYLNNANQVRMSRTDMGSGRWASEGYQYAAFARRIRMVNMDYNYTTPTVSTLATRSNCYSVAQFLSGDSEWTRYIYFGGAGYNANCTENQDP